MVAELLVAHRATSVSTGLVSLLQEAGFQVHTAADISSACSALNQFPALLLLDLDLTGPGCEDLPDLEQACTASEIPCLHFSSNGMASEQMAALAPWSSGSIMLPDRRELVLEQVRLQLELRNMREEKDLLGGRLAAKQLELQEGLKSAAAIQQSLLPTFLPRSDSFRFAWRFSPCETVGGDLFNLQQLTEDRLMAYLLDVSGHGVSAAMVTVSVYQSLSLHTGQLVKRTSEKPPFYDISAPAKVLAELDKEYPYERFEKFFTIAYLLLDPASGEVHYCNGGHPPPVLLRKTGGHELLEAGGTLVGMGGLVPYQDARIRLEPGDRMFLYSDGITEYPGQKEEFFGEERFMALLDAGRQTPLDDLLEDLLRELQDFSGGVAPPDDLTILAIEYVPNGNHG